MKKIIRYFFKNAFINKQRYAYYGFVKSKNLCRVIERKEIMAYDKIHADSISSKIFQDSPEEYHKFACLDGD